MNYQARYDELDIIIRNIDSLVNEINDKYYIDVLNELKFEAQNEIEEVEEKLQEEYEQEEREINYQFERSRL